MATHSRRPTSGATRRVALWGPVAVYMLAIFILSSQSDVPLPHGLTDKQGHSLGYLGLGITVTRACIGGLGAPVSLSRGLAAVALSVAYGATDEWHQAFVPFRESDRWDLATDWLGAMVGVLTWAWIEERGLPRRSSRSDRIGDGPARLSTPDR